MAWFENKKEKSELIDKNSEDLILEQIKKIAKDDDAFRLLRLLIRIMDENSNISLICSFYGLSRFETFIAGGFYKILPIVDYPFYSGDILIFSHDKEYKKGDTLLYYDLTKNGNEEELVFHYLFFEYKKEDGIVVRSVFKNDEIKYTIQSWQVLGRLVYKYEFGSIDWLKFIESEGIDKDKIFDDIEKSITWITDSKDFIEKELVLSELNNRKKILKHNK